ncbi:MAG: 4Fe-4S dicluster domain-containing protein [Chitinivibrionales bacterium]|nr:4Fe-4S dicluster domain-containing protein [Chitinivibrionales bacterium]
MELREQLRDTGVQHGAGLVGFADISASADNLVKAGYPLAGEYRSAVSVGVRLIDSVVYGLIEGSQRATARVLYRKFCYDLVNDKLNRIAFELSRALERAGFRAMPIPASADGTHMDGLTGLFSHKAAARLAGLGWIGKSCLLITPEFGPRVRWATVLTDAKLTAERGVLEDGCGTCRVCVDNCPPQAFTGAGFDENDDRSVRMDAFRCDEHQRKMQAELGIRVCGLCVALCPHGRKCNRDTSG